MSSESMRRPQRILFVTSKSLGGSGKYIAALATGLRADMHCDLLYYPLGVAQDAEIEAPFRTVFRLKRKPSFSIGSLYANIRQVASIVSEGHYHWVHSHTSFGGVYGRLGAKLATATPRVGHTIHAFAADEFVPYPQKAVYWLAEKALDLATDAYVAPSRYMARYGRRMHLVGAGKTRVIHNALPLPQIQPDDAGRSARRQALGVAADELLYLFCGRLEEQKGVDVMFKALSLLPATIKWRVLVCGTGSLLTSLTTLADKLGLSPKVQWLGWQPELDKFYAAADIYVMPSRWESFGLVFLEAMNHALPVLATDAQAILEVVEHGVTGLLSPNEDADALARNLSLLSCDPSLRAALGAAGRQRLMSLFAFEQFVERHATWYRGQGERDEA